MSLERDVTSVSLRELEVRLYAHLRIPMLNGPGGCCPRVRATASEPRLAGPNTTSVRRLKSALSQLERDVSGIGAIPPDYPRHVDLVMRVISALLPWYSRSLVQFGRSASESIRAVSDALEELARAHQSLALEVSRLRDSSSSARRSVPNRVGGRNDPVS
jgi:hypothetical protein